MSTPVSILVDTNIGIRTPGAYRIVVIVAPDCDSHVGDVIATAEQDLFSGQTSKARTFLPGPTHLRRWMSTLSDASQERLWSAIETMCSSGATSRSAEI